MPPALMTCGISLGKPNIGLVLNSLMQNLLPAAMALEGRSKILGGARFEYLLAFLDLQSDVSPLVLWLTGRDNFL